MKAIVYTQHGLPIHDPQSLHELELPTPNPGARDLLVKVRAIAVNPVDIKVRRNAPTEAPRVLGWDAVGEVQAVGPQVSRFKPGDVVFFAGSIGRAGAYAEYTLVDERIAALKPRRLDDAQAAALPLTSITAWELLFDRLRLGAEASAGQTLLVIGAAGGVGSILVQLARQLTPLRVVGTASRSQTQQWVAELGAHAVIDHHQPLAPQLAQLGIEQVEHVASLTHTDRYFSQLVELLAPQGQLGLIDDPATPLDVVALKRKALSLHWEMMFTRPLFETPDMHRQHELLTQVAAMVDAGQLRTTVREHFGTINAANLRRAHAVQESGQVCGKIVLAGFETWRGK